MDRITVGQILKAFGIRGEVKVKPITDDSERFFKLKVVYIGQNPYKICGCRIAEGYVYLKFVGVPDRTEAEKLAGEFLQIDRVNAVQLPEGSYFIADMQGCKLSLSDGTEIGVITDVLQYGAADVITVKSADNVYRFPFLKKLNAVVDIDRKTMVVDAKVFSEVSVSED